MMNWRKGACNVFLAVQFFILTGSCLEPFNPSIPDSQQNILVVEGNIIVAGGKSIFKVSRTTSVNATRPTPESGATVSIVSDTEEVYPVLEVADGVYETLNDNLPPDRAYQLRIQLTNGAEYVSQQTRAKITPPIDSISWRIAGAVNIYVNSHDPTNATRFYQWEYEEDWQIRSPYRSLFEWDGDTIVSRHLAEQNQMFDCWKSRSSKDIIVHSTTRLESDALNFRLKTLPFGEEVMIRYSIRVRQHALTEEHFNYLSLIQKNTNQVGSFFDPMPSEIHGNIFNVNDLEEMVVGFVGVYSLETSTKFINGSDLNVPGTQERCDRLEFKVQEEFSAIRETLSPPSLWIPFGTRYEEGKLILIAMDQYCLDCRLRGNPVKPDFW